MATGIDGVVQILDNTTAIVEACNELGEVHRTYGVKPHHFDVRNDIQHTPCSITKIFSHAGSQ